MDPRTAETIADARWFPWRYDARDDTIRFAWIAPETHRALTFITDARPPELRPIPRADIGAVLESRAPVHVILHSGLGGSTLLARALAQSGIVTTLKEPPILTDVVAFGLRAEAVEASLLLEQIVSLLSRPFEAGEALVCKMSSVGNGLSAAIASMRPDTQVLCLQTPVAQFLASLASKGADGRAGGRRLFVGLRNARMAGVELGENELSAYGDLQLAALAWLSIQKMIGEIARTFGPGRVRSIGSEVLIGRQREALSAIAEQFRLDLDVGARVASGVFERHAKTGQPFDARERAAALSRTLRDHNAEISGVVEWIGKVASANDIACDLPHPLLA